MHEAVVCVGCGDEIPKATDRRNISTKQPKEVWRDFLRKTRITAFSQIQSENCKNISTTQKTNHDVFLFLLAKNIQVSEWKY